MQTAAVMPKGKPIVAKTTHPVLFARTTKATHDWVHQTAKSAGYTAQEWMNELFTNMRTAGTSKVLAASSKKTSKKKASKKKKKVAKGARH